MYFFLNETNFLHRRQLWIFLKNYEATLFGCFYRFLLILNGIAIIFDDLNGHFFSENLKVDNKKEGCLEEKENEKTRIPW